MKKTILLISALFMFLLFVGCVNTGSKCEKCVITECKDCPVQKECEKCPVQEKCEPQITTQNSTQIVYLNGTVEKVFVCTNGTEVKDSSLCIVPVKTTEERITACDDAQTYKFDACVLIIAEEQNSIGICKKIRMGNSQDNCILLLATKNRNRGYCLQALDSNSCLGQYDAALSNTTGN